MVNYEVVRPEESQSRTGRTYQDLIEMWAQWLVSDTPDAHNYGDVVFLRGLDFPESPEKIGYSGRPATMVGTRALNISDNQFLFLGVICTLVNEIDDHAKTTQERSFIIWRDTMQGDNPPTAAQILIDGAPLDTGRQEGDLRAFLTWSSDFVLHVPDVPYGRSLKDYLDIPITATGDIPAMTGGYCILFKFTNPGPHSLVFHARGVLESIGQYFAAGTYTINVSPARVAMPPPHPISNRPVFQRMLQELYRRHKDSEVPDTEYDDLKRTIESLTKVTTVNYER